MADIKIRGYVKRPNRRDNRVTFTVAEKYRGRDGAPNAYAYWDVTQWDATEPPADGDYVEVVGYMTEHPSIWTSQERGSSGIRLRVKATRVTVNPARDQQAAPRPAPRAQPANSRADWGAGPADDEIPF